MKTNTKVLRSLGEGGNTKRYSPIPWLALHIAIFNDCNAKQALAKARATLADRLYALSQTKLARRGDWRRISERRAQ